MPRRPSSSHKLGDIAYGKISQIFTDEGWTVNRIQSDYGEDFLVRIFERGISRPLYFFVQAKGHKNIADKLIKGGTMISFPMKTKHFVDWKHFLEPVILAIWDEKTKIAYWQLIQDALKDYDEDEQMNTFNIHIPIENKLNREGLMRIALRTLKQFELFEREQEMLEVLIKFLKRDFQFEIDYDKEELGFIEMKWGLNQAILYCTKWKELRYEIGEEDSLDEISTNIYRRNLIERTLKEAVEINRRLNLKNEDLSARIIDLNSGTVKEYKSLEDLQVKE